MTSRERFLRILRWGVVVLLFVAPLLRNKDLMEPWLLKWCAVYLASVFAAFYLILENKLFWLTGKLKIAFIALVVIRAFTFIMWPNWMSLVTAIDAFCLLSLISFFVLNFRSDNLEIGDLFWPFVYSSIVLAALAFVQFFIYRISQGIAEPAYFSSTFGNINQMSEYLVFTLPLIFYFFRTGSRLHKWISIPIAIAWLFFIFAGLSRSAIIAVIIFGLVSLFRKKFIPELICIAVAVILVFATLPESKQSGYGVLEKSSGAVRAEIYKGSFKMLLATPLGVGGDGYDFGFTPYQLSTDEKPVELMHYESPHCEFLKWGIEGGWLFLIAQIALWAIFYFKVLRLSWSDEKAFLIKSSFFVMVPQLIFQFPFELGVSTLYLSLVIALLLSTFTLTEVKQKLSIKLILGLAALAILINGVLYATSNYLDINAKEDVKTLETACKIYPENWHACVNYARGRALSPQPYSAMPVLKSELKRRPFNWLALKLVAFTYFRAKQNDKACEVGLVYSMIMSGVGEGPKFIGSLCPNIPSPVLFKNPKQFKKDYLTWLDAILARPELSGPG